VAATPPSAEPPAPDGPGRWADGIGIRRRATTYGYSPAEREGADACAAYLEHKQDYLDYLAFLAAGRPVAG